jgi:hypothetical protein
MSCSTLGPQLAIRAGPTGRDGGEVMIPWPRTAGTRVRRAAMVNCIVRVVLAGWMRIAIFFVKYRNWFYTHSQCMHAFIGPKVVATVFGSEP